VEKGNIVATINGQTRLVLKAERIILNFISHLSGIANLTASYVKELAGTSTRLLDTRKTLPGLRYPEKYAVLAGGGLNHRFSLEDMLMLKDNHIDAAGSITRAVQLVRKTYSPCPPLEVECRNLDEVKEAALAGVNRIMLDNMDLPTLKKALLLIPKAIESEVSGGITRECIGELARLSPSGPDFISVGRLTHSAPAADFSIKFARP
jgi:nicotinate-nucleotide pyrophosphorylase (carboxylating)